MAKTRIILELGAGTALHGGEYTKAAVRAVDDFQSSLAQWAVFARDDDPAAPTARAMTRFLEHVRDEAQALAQGDVDTARVAELERRREELDRARWEALGR